MGLFDDVLDMLNAIREEANLTRTENDAVTHRSSENCVLDLFFRAGGMRDADEAEIETVVMRAFAENPLYTMRVLFYVRDVRGGLGERRFFRVAMAHLAKENPEAVLRNLHLFAEYGRYDDLLVLIGTPCENAAVQLIAEQLKQDTLAMAAGERVSLLAKWLPSVNTSSAEACRAGRHLAKRLNMSEKTYRKTLSALRKYSDILENRLREQDYTFDYAKLPSKALFKYRAAFTRRDAERWKGYLEQVAAGKASMHTASLYPYDIVRQCMTRYGADGGPISEEERRALDVMWNQLPNYCKDGRNALAVVDGSGSMYSMYGKKSVRPIDAALSLGMYFAEHNKGRFANNFITFSRTPRLVEIKGADIWEKTKFCASYNEAANTNLEAVFRLILNAAVKHRIPQSEMPAQLYIISDMEFDSCVVGGNNETLFQTMKRIYAGAGYQLPEVIFWNVSSRNENIPVTMSTTGAALVSGSSPSVFEMTIAGAATPMAYLLHVVESERYAAVT